MSDYVLWHERPAHAGARITDNRQTPSTLVWARRPCHGAVSPCASARKQRAHAPVLNRRRVRSPRSPDSVRPQGILSATILHLATIQSVNRFSSSTIITFLLYILLGGAASRKLPSNDLPLLPSIPSNMRYLSTKSLFSPFLSSWPSTCYIYARTYDNTLLSEQKPVPCRRRL